MNKNDVIQSIDKFHGYILLALDLTEDAEAVQRFMDDPAFVLQQKNPQIAHAAFMLFTLFQLFKHKNLVPISSCGKAFLVEQTENEIIFYQQYNGSNVKYKMNKATGKITIDATEYFESIGFSGIKEYISSDIGLDDILEFKEKHPDVPFFGKEGLLNLYKGFLN